MSRLALAMLLLCAHTATAWADQCELVDRETATRLSTAMSGRNLKNLSVVKFCEPCGKVFPKDLPFDERVKTWEWKDAGGGLVQLEINGTKVDLAYVYVLDDRGAYLQNLGLLADCGATGVSAVLPSLKLVGLGPFNLVGTMDATLTPVYNTCAARPEAYSAKFEIAQGDLLLIASEVPAGKGKPVAYTKSGGGCGQDTPTAKTGWGTPTCMQDKKGVNGLRLWTRLDMTYQIEGTKVVLGKNCVTIYEVVGTPTPDVAQGGGASQGGVGITGVVETKRPIVDDDGGLDADSVYKKVKGTYQSQVAQCYSDGLEKNSGLKGRVDVTITIGKKGEVTAVDVSGFDDGVDACIKGSVRQWKFDAPPRGSATFQFPFSFTSK